MEVLLAVVGVLLVAVATVDSLWTTLWPDGGGGPITTVVSRGLWGLATRLPDGLRQPAQRVAGPALLLVAVGLWVVLLVAGWWLVFLAGEAAVVSSTAGQPAGAGTRLYFVGFGLFTLGIGDYVPQGTGWQLATVLLTGSGLFLVTLSITYLVQVISAVVDKRSFASSVRALGSSPQEVVITAWDGTGFGALDQQLVSLGSSLGRLAEQHLAYPVLHYFHTRDPEKASSLAVATLDDALTLLAVGVVGAARPSPAALSAARRTVATFLQTVTVAMPDADPDPPPAPDLDAVRAGGIPTVDDRDFADGVDVLAGRRSRMALLVAEDAWPWPAGR